MTDHTVMQIPRDIMRTATSVATALIYPDVDDDGRAYLTQEHINIIARAILQERERCARIAEGNAKSFNFQQALAEGDDMEVGAKSAQITIAAKIRSADKPSPPKYALPTNSILLRNYIVME